MKLIEIRPNGTKRVATRNNEPPKTDPSYLKETDVNHIIKKFTTTGQLTHITRKQGSYADVSNATDLLTALNIIRESTNSWDLQPEHVKDRFGTPEKLIKFLQDPKNLKEAEKLGLLTIREESGLIQNESAAKGAEEVPEEQPGATEGPRTRSPKEKAPIQQNNQQQPQ